MKFCLYIHPGLPGVLHVPLGRRYSEMVLVFKDGPPVKRYLLRVDGRQVFESTLEIAQLRYLIKHAKGEAPPIPPHLRFVRFEVDTRHNSMSVCDVEFFNDSMEPAQVDIFLD